MRNIRRLIFCMLMLPWAVQADLRTAMNTYHQGRFTEAREMLQPLARSGDPTAAVTLGRMYHFGEGVEIDNARAFQHFLGPAKSGHAEAQFYIGSMFLYGDIIPEDEQDPDIEAARWLIEAAVRGHAEAQYVLGLLLFAGTGVEQNPEEAMVWIERSAVSGHAEANRFLGRQP